MMVTYIALLRGINVGGKNKIKMADLKQMLVEIGFKNVETYIQSGNIIFDSEQNKATIGNKIERGILDSLGLNIGVVIREAEELEQLIQECPFTEAEIAAVEAANTEGESFYVAFLSNPPLTEKVELVHKYKTEHEEYKIKGDNIYLLFRNSIRNSKFANHLHKLELSVTVRNWKTVLKLNELIKNRVDKE